MSPEKELAPVVALLCCHSLTLTMSMTMTAASLQPDHSLEMKSSSVTVCWKMPDSPKINKAKLKIHISLPQY